MLSLLVLLWKPPDLCKPSKGHSFFPAVAENIQEHFHFKSTNVDHEITSVQALLLAADTVWSVVIPSGSRMDCRVDLMLSPPTRVCAPIIRPLSPAAEKAALPEPPRASSPWQGSGNLDDVPQLRGQAS